MRVVVAVIVIVIVGISESGDTRVHRDNQYQS